MLDLTPSSHEFSFAAELSDEDIANLAAFYSQVK